MKVLHYCICSYLLSLLCAFTAFAHEQVEQTDFLRKNQTEVTAKVQKHEVTLGIGGTASTTPYRNYSTEWLGYPVLVYEGPYAYIRGLKAGIKLINVDFLEASLYGGYDPTSFTPANSSNTGIRKLDTRYSSAMTGGQVMLKTPYGMLHSSIEGDVLGHSNGLAGEFGYMNSFDIGDLEIIPAIGASWSDNKYNTYYYGISPSEASKSGFREYTSGSGVSPYVGLTLDYSLTDNLEVYWNGQATFLSSAIKNSPMVSRNTTSNISVGITYSFGVE